MTMTKAGIAMWYETYKFKENPLKITPMPEKLVGMEDEIKRIETAIKSNDLILLTGFTGSGKTTLVKYLTNYLSKQLTPIYIDCASSNGVDMTKLLTKKSLFGLVKKKYASQDNVVLFCDEAQRASDKELDTIKAEFDSGIIKAVVFSTISESNLFDSLKTRLAEHVELDYPSMGIMTTMLNRRFERGINPFTQSAIEEIVERSSHNPRLALINAEKVCKELHQTRTKEGSITPIDVAEIIKHEKIVKKIQASQDDLDKTKAVKGKFEGKKLVREEISIIGSEKLTKLKKALSPLQWSIVEQLSNSFSALTYDELVEKVYKSKGSIAKQLSRLALISDTDLMNRKGIIEAIVTKTSKDGRPAFELTEEIRLLLAKK